MKTKTPLSILFFLLLAVATTWAETINLATVMTDKSLKDGKELKVADGDVLTGTLSGNLKILIASNATVTLNGVTINGDNNSKYQWAGLTCEGNCNIVLAEKSKNIVKGFYETYPGIYVPQVGNHMLNNNTLTISGTGSLEASSNGEGAGIGAGYNIDCGNITISGGIVTATGGSNAAGIGGGYFASVENITISGGIVTATGGSHAAGIGAGNSASVGNITIGGDKMMVTAIGGGICSIDKGHSGFSESKITIDGIATSNICENPYVYDNRMLLTHTDISVAAIADQTYTGSEICPEVRVADDESQLVADVDYTVECSNNISVGTAEMTITGMGRYVGSISKTFKIVPKEITIAWGTQTSFVYNGTEQVPTATAKGLVNGDKCTITVSGAAKNASSYTAKATELSNGNYKLPTKNLEKPFEITPKEVSITWGEQASFVYNGTEQVPTATAKGLVNGDKCTKIGRAAAREGG
jgi:hypothetical protein